MSVCIYVRIHLSLCIGRWIRLLGWLVCMYASNMDVSSRFAACSCSLPRPSPSNPRPCAHKADPRCLTLLVINLCVPHLDKLFLVLADDWTEHANIDLLSRVKKNLTDSSPPRPQKRNPALTPPKPTLTPLISKRNLESSQLWRRGRLGLRNHLARAWCQATLAMSSFREEDKCLAKALF